MYYTYNQYVSISFIVNTSDIIVTSMQFHKTNPYSQFENTTNAKWL